jgi:hypothetical protein
MQRAMLNRATMRVADATAEAVRPMVAACKPVKQPKKDANMNINRTSGKRGSASQKILSPHKTIRPISANHGSYLLLSRLACF